MTQVDSRSRIIAAAKHELQHAGILGLRVQDVAQRAGTSISLIYKYFEDRDGLLARVLGDMHDERIDNWEKLFSHALSDSTPRGEYSVEDLLRNLPLPNSESFQALGWDRAQMLAALKENPKLRARIEETTQRLFSLTLKVVTNADTSKHPITSNHRVIALVISSLNLIFINNDLLGDHRISDDEYKGFLKTYFTGFQK
ncbi:MAG: TetR/AcrR family transcriptional regulator [Actinomycetes bacterium]